MWSRYEKLVIDILALQKADSKNLAIIAHRFSHAKQGSIKFWTAVDKAFASIAHMSSYDLSMIIQAFSLMNLLSEKKFISLCSRLYEGIGS